MAARGSPATKKPKCDPSDLTRLPDAELAAQIEALDTEQHAADAAFIVCSFYFSSTIFRRPQSIDNPGNSEVFYTSSNTSTQNPGVFAVASAISGNLC